MKTLKILFFLVLSISMFHCTDGLEPNELDGDTDIDLVKVDNEYGVYVKINDVNVNINSDSKIVESDNGIVTINVKADISTLPLYSDLISDDYKNSNGNIDADVKLKFTSKGIQDFYHSDEDISKPFTIIKYDDEVGTKYEFTRSDGTKVTRTITAKSTVDDFEMGYYLIKTTEIEEVYDNNAIEKTVYLANHKFGLVNVSFYHKTGNVLDLQLIPWGVL